MSAEHLLKQVGLERCVHAVASWVICLFRLERDERNWVSLSQAQEAVAMPHAWGGCEPGTHVSSSIKVRLITGVSRVYGDVEVSPLWPPAFCAQVDSFI